MPEVNVEKYCLIFSILSREVLHLGGIEDLENALLLGLKIPHPGGVEKVLNRVEIDFAGGYCF